MRAGSAAALALAAVAAAAPGLARAQPSPAWPGYTVKLFRWDEDYAWLKDKPREGLLALKYRPLDSVGQVYASFGGEYRFRVEAYDAPDFGLVGASDFTSAQQRVLLHVDVHFGEAVRAFVQLGYGDERGRKPFARPFDESAIDLAQAFVDFKTGPARWRIGRQEVALGRYVAVRDSSNIRRTFDGLRLDTPVGGWAVTALAARPTRTRDGAFDDDPDAAETLAAVTADHAIPGTGFRVGLAALQRTNHHALYLSAAGAGRERRDTLGARIFGQQGRFDLDAQASWQFGDFRPAVGRRLEIDAWGAALEAGWTLPAPRTVRVAVRLDSASGDRNPHDGRLATFDLPYPNLSYLTDAAIFAPRNVSDAQPFVTVQATRALTLTAGAQFLWRNSTADAVYSPVGTPVLRPGGRARYVAAQPYLRLDWRLTGLTELQAAVVEALPQEALRQAGGRRTLSFGYVSIAQRF